MPTDEDCLRKPRSPTVFWNHGLCAEEVVPMAIRYLVPRLLILSLTRRRYWANGHII